MADARQLVDKLWAFCSVLRDDGVGTLDYTEQLTYLLFLKMAHERETRALNPEKIVPDDCSWQRLLDQSQVFCYCRIPLPIMDTLDGQLFELRRVFCLR